MTDISMLLERYVEIVNCPKNQKNKKFWENSKEDYLVERWRGRSLRRENTPFTIAMDIAGYSSILGIDCAAYYSEADVNLRDQLRYAIWEFDNLDCHRYFENTVFGSIGSVFEATWFGADIFYLPGQAPWYDEKNPVLSSKKDLIKLKPFDFYDSGLCPKAIEFYEHHMKVCEPYGIRAMFPVAMRSPFSVAIMLRGFENLLMDMLEDPEFFEDLMDLITSYLIDYSTARARYLGEPEPTALLFNDEISTPILSNNMYKEMIFPYEKKIAARQGIRYWHSCGVTQSFYDSIAELPGLRMMHLGPWSDVPSAADVFGKKDIALEICLSSNRDMYEKDEEQMAGQLEEIKQACDGNVRYSVRLDGIAVLSSQQECLEKVAAWNRAAKKVFLADD